MCCRTEDALGELLREIERHSSSVRFEAMANILAIHCQSDGILQFSILTDLTLPPSLLPSLSLLPLSSPSLPLSTLSLPLTSLHSPPLPPFLYPPPFLPPTDKCIQFTALTWMKTFVTLARRSMMVFTANILVSILPCVAYDNDKSRIPSQYYTYLLPHVR